MTSWKTPHHYFRIFLNKVAERGFTLVEILITVVIIAVLAGIGTVTYNGIRYKAADSQTHGDIKQLQTLIESDKLIKNSYAPEMSGLNARPSVNTAILYSTNAQPYPVYDDLEPDENAQLLIKVCNDIAATSPYNAHIDLCAIAGNNINIKGDSCTATIKGPLQTSADFQLLKTNCSAAANSALDTANTKILDKFLAQGGTFPVVMPKGNSQPALPEPRIIQSRASAFCLEARSTLYLSIIYSVNSIDKTIVKTPCNATLPALPPYL